MLQLKKKIAIIGFGAAGVLILHKLKEIISEDLTVDIFQSSKLFATGLAYQNDNDNILLNVTIDKMVIDDENPNLYKEWLEAKQNNKYNLYTPRYLFGDFLKNIFETVNATSKNFINIIKQDVVSITKVNELYNVITKSKVLYGAYNYIIISIGQNLPYNYYNLNSPQYFNLPYPIKKP